MKLPEKTPEQWRAWLEKHDDEPEGCIACGRMAGCCEKYPNCPGNLEWKATSSEGEQQ
jgi:hypothetical protein